MAQTFNPESPIGLKLKENLKAELSSRFNIAEDPEDVAEYIVVLIVSNKNAAEIASEVKEITDIPIDEDFVNSIFSEINRLTELQNEQQAIPVESNVVTNEVANKIVGVPETPVAVPPENFGPDETEQDISMDSPSFPSGPKAMMGRKTNTAGSNKFNGRTGVTKGSGITKGNKNGNRKPNALANGQNFEKALAMSNGNIMNVKPFVQKPSKGRCTKFPYCENKNCQFAHPTRVCFAFPNCTNPPGTCNYLHPGEDEELMAKLEKTKQEYREKKRIQVTGTIGICKYGILCSKELCPFGHPTPANKEAKVLVLQWCHAGKQCTAPDCTLAHPSPNYQAPPPEPKPAPTRIEPTLEQCKFGPACTNYKCPRRHATSLVTCREGANCTRFDCFFSHPIEEDCRFGVQCKNKNCMFRHPQGREIQSNIWTKEMASANNATNSRPFAVPDDQIMEQAVQDS